MLWRLVRAGDEAVDRHRDVQLQLAHRSPSADMLVGQPSASEVIGQAQLLQRSRWILEERDRVAVVIVDQQTQWCATVRMLVVDEPGP
jgi:hypothetical protein